MPQTRKQTVKRDRHPDRLAGYITVAERVQKFYERFPDGSLQTAIVSDDGTRLIMQAKAYRNPDDGQPGVGHAEEVRGHGPVNETSAVENAETSAWGRAIAALGFEVKKGTEIASREEMERATVKSKIIAAQPGKVAPLDTISAEDALNLFETFKNTDPDIDSWRLKAGELGIAGAGTVKTALARLTPAQAVQVDAWLSEKADQKGTE